MAGTSLFRSFKSQKKSPLGIYLDHRPVQSAGEIASACRSCALCGAPACGTGIFDAGDNVEMRDAVMLLRKTPPMEGKTPGLAYGLCRDHIDMPNVTDLIEEGIRNEAATLRRRVH